MMVIRYEPINDKGKRCPGYMGFVRADDYAALEAEVGKLRLEVETGTRARMEGKPVEVDLPATLYPTVTTLPVTR